MMSSSVTPILPGTMAWSEKLVQYPQNALVYEVQFYHSPYMFIYVHIFSLFKMTIKHAIKVGCFVGVARSQIDHDRPVYPGQPWP